MTSFILHTISNIIYYTGYSLYLGGRYLFVKEVEEKNTRNNETIIQEKLDSMIQKIDELESKIDKKHEEIN